MKKLFSSGRNPIAACLFLLLAGGLFVYGQLKTALFPEVTFPKIKIIADAVLQPVDKMMVSVTGPLENTIRQVPGLLTLRSTTSRGSCEISAFLDWSSDMDISLQGIQSKITESSTSCPGACRCRWEK